MANLDASAKNMQAVCKAKDVHNSARPWGGMANRVHLAWFDLERIGWEEGDVICGLVVVGDDKVATGMMRVSCDAEPDGDKEIAEEEVVEAVSERELRHAFWRARGASLTSRSFPNACAEQVLLLLCRPAGDRDVLVRLEAERDAAVVAIGPARGRRPGRASARAAPPAAAPRSSA